MYTQTGTHQNTLEQPTIGPKRNRRVRTGYPKQTKMKSQHPKPMGQSTER